MIHQPRSIDVMEISRHGNAFVTTSVGAAHRHADPLIEKTAPGTVLEK
jgi:hypothetical protein